MNKQTRGIIEVQIDQAKGNVKRYLTTLKALEEEQAGLAEDIASYADTIADLEQIIADLETILRDDETEF